MDRTQNSHAQERGEFRVVALCRRSLGWIAVALVALAAYALPASAAPLRSIKVGVPGLSIGYGPWYLAQAEGFFKKNGLDVTFAFLADNTLPEALVSNGIQATPLTGSVTSAAFAGFKVKSVGLLVAKLPWMVIAKNEIKSVDDLKHKKIITSPPKAAPNLVLNFLLMKHGLDPKDVEHLSIGAVAARQQLMIAGHADAILDDVKSGLQLMSEMKDVHIIIPASEMPYQVGTGLGVSDELIAKDPGLVKAMLRALVEANVFIKHHPDQAAPVLAKELKMDLDISKQATQVLIDDFSPSLVPTEEVYDNEAKIRSLGGKSTTATEIKATWDTRLAADVDRELGSK